MTATDAWIFFIKSHAYSLRAQEKCGKTPFISQCSQKWYKNSWNLPFIWIRTKNLYGFFPGPFPILPPRRTSTCAKSISTPWFYVFNNSLVRLLVTLQIACFIRAKVAYFFLNYINFSGNLQKSNKKKKKKLILKIVKVLKNSSKNQPGW